MMGVSTMENIYKSPNNNLLTFSGHNPVELKVLTFELSSKWSDPFLIKSLSEIVPVEDFYSLQNDFLNKHNEFASLDHCPNPLYLAYYCEQMKYFLCPISYEICVGRWVTDQHYLQLIPIIK